MQSCQQTQETAGESCVPPDWAVTTLWWLGAICWVQEVIEELRLPMETGVASPGCIASALLTK